MANENKGSESKSAKSGKPNFFKRFAAGITKMVSGDAQRIKKGRMADQAAYREQDYCSRRGYGSRRLRPVGF
jgi:hypothetical protein